MVDVEHIRGAARMRAEDKEERRFEVEKQQRDQHYQLQMGKQEEILRCLRLQLQRQEQRNPALRDFQLLA